MVIKVIKKMLGGSPRVDFSDARRNDPCPCGSGKKFKSCHYDQESSRRREASFSKLFKGRK